MSKDYQLYLDTNGSDFVIKLDYKNTYLLFSMLDFVVREFQDDSSESVSPEEIKLAETIAGDIYDFLDDDLIQDALTEE